jgi:Holliday junction resolvasome RuvABC endonuclease subunit
MKTRLTLWTPQNVILLTRVGDETFMFRESKASLRQSQSENDMNTTMILALDLGTTTGWALRSAEGLITSGVQHFKPQRFEGGGMRYLRFKRWLDEVQDLAASGSPLTGLGAIFFEEVRRHAGVDAAHAYGGFLGQLTAWCEQHQIPYQGVPVGTIKKHATGKGNASKAEMVESARARGHTPTDDNEADAIALLYLALANAQEEV